MLLCTENKNILMNILRYIRRNVNENKAKYTGKIAMEIR